MAPKSQAVVNFSQQPATWNDYLVYRDNPDLDRAKLFFYNDYLFVEMGEGFKHAQINSFFDWLFITWFSMFSDVAQCSEYLGGCTLEKQNKKSVSPDLVLYLGEDIPQVQSDESDRRYINLDQWRVPNLVGEISDTTLKFELDKKKRLYADLKITEYWVVNVSKKQVMAFLLQSDGSYEDCAYSVALKGLPFSLLEQALERLNRETSPTVARWFNQQLANLNLTSHD